MRGVGAGCGACGGGRAGRSGDTRPPPALQTIVTGVTSVDGKVANLKGISNSSTHQRADVLYVTFAFIH